MEKGKIHLLFNGDCNVGKTVAWCCMYKRMEEGIGNFRLEYKEKETYNFLGEMYARMERGRALPFGTSEVSAYTFRFKRKNIDICEAVVMDYNNSSVNRDSESYKRMLKEATMEIYMIPADVLNDYICIRKDNAPGSIEREVKRAKVAMSASRIKTCMMEWEALREDRPPVLFYLTQSDKTKCSDEEKMEMLKTFIKEYNFIHFAEGEDRKVLGCHSTLGRNLELYNNRILSGFAPRGFEIPFLLAAGYYRAKEVREQALELNWKIAVEKAVFTPAAFVLKSIGLGWLGDRRDKAKELERRREELLKINEEILIYLEGTGKNCVFYLEGTGEERPLRKFFI